MQFTQLNCVQIAAIRITARRLMTLDPSGSTVNVFCTENGEAILIQKEGEAGGTLIHDEQALEIDAWGSMQMNASQFVDVKH